MRAAQERLSGRIPADLVSGAARESPAGWPEWRAWLVLGVLCFVYVLNFLDRQLLSILAKPIQDSLHVTDGQLGLIGGLYFPPGQLVR
jgi:sugar phosphate permease